MTIAVNQDTPASPRPFAILQRATAAYWTARCLHAVADLGVADALGEAPASLERLASAVGAHPQALDRVLTLVAADGIFQATRSGEWSHTLASRLLRSDHPQSVRSYVRMLGLPPLWESAGALKKALTTGQPVGNEVVTGGIWNYLANRPEANTIFNDAMSGKAQAQVASVIRQYDFSTFARVADIGGGQGHLIHAVVQANPHVHGVLFDQPHVLSQASAIASDRLTLHGGSFFSDPLPAADAYIVMEVIHDWPDEESETILKAIRRAAPAHARLLLIEALIPDDPGPNWIKTLDIIMLTVLGGRQRSYAEYEALLERCGFRLVRKIDVGMDYWILEAAVR
jgi:O-methyltransferase domain